jgi:hypothetical protein
MRAITALNLPDVTPNAIPTAPPEIRLVDPRTLGVDESYQRGLSERSMRLIRKIVAGWDWRAFKPPVVVEVEGRLEVIDGQHTAIAAVTHGGITELPVLVIEADEKATRATAFVRHNRDRIQVTPTQLHSALVAAGDEDAVTIEQVCERAGAKVLKNPPPMGRYDVGDLVAVTTLRALINRRHAAGARRILDICVKGGAAPISAGLLKAVEYLLFAAEYKGEMSDERVAIAISANLSSLEAEAERFATERKVAFWRALASVIFMNRRKFKNAA